MSQEIFERAYLVNHIYCQCCARGRVFTCSMCQQQIVFDSPYGAERCARTSGDHRICDNCATQAGVLNHYYAPAKPKFHGKGKLFFGFELEVENKSQLMSNNDAARLTLPWVYCKHDGSIENGFEVVSQPATFHWLRSKASEIAAMLEQLRRQGFRSFNTTTCGLHVHVSKDAVGNATLYKVLKLFYENPEFILFVSQRKANSFKQWSKLTDGGSLTIKAKTKEYSTTRYSAINLSPRDTVEFRIFRGTLNPFGFWKNIEFVHAAIEYAKQESMKQVSEVRFRRFVANHQMYLRLAEFLRYEGKLKSKAKHNALATILDDRTEKEISTLRA